MSRLALINDLPAQICWRAIHGELEETVLEVIDTIFYAALIDRDFCRWMMFDIAYRIGYAKSKFQISMGETKYKYTKKWIRDMLVSELEEKNDT